MYFSHLTSASFEEDYGEISSVRPYIAWMPNKSSYCNIAIKVLSFELKTQNKKYLVRKKNPLLTQMEIFGPQIQTGDI